MKFLLSFFTLVTLFLGCSNDKISNSIALDMYNQSSSDAEYEQWYYDSSLQASIEKDVSLWQGEQFELSSKELRIGEELFQDALDNEEEYPFLSEKYEGIFSCLLYAEHKSITLSPDANSYYSYSDVIELRCLKESNVTIRASDGRVFEKLKNYDTFTIYYAKGLGEVAYEDRDCHYRYADDLDDNLVDDTLQECSFEERSNRYLKN